MPKFSDGFLNELHEKIDIAALIGEYTRLERKGGRLWGLCPFHSEKTASFTVDPEKRFFYCFGCKKGGSAIDFYMEIEKAGFREAVESLAKKYGIPIPNGAISNEENAVDSDRATREELFSRIAGTFHFFLIGHEQGRAALQYLESRNIKKESIERFCIGYAPANRWWLKDFLRKKNYSDDFLASSALFSSNYPDIAFFSDRIMFPIRNSKAQVVGFGGRLLKGEGPKYLNTRETDFFKKGELLFGIDVALAAIKRHEKALICEGYMDVIACHQAGLEIAIAPLGTAFTHDHAKLLKRWVKQVLFLFDSDEAGQTATDRAITISIAAGIEAYVVTLATAKDPAEVVQNEGEDALKSCVNRQIPWADYCIAKALRVYDIASPGGRVEAAMYLQPFYENLDSNLRKEAFLELVNRKTGIDSSALKNEYSKQIQGRSRATEPMLEASKDLTPTPDLNLLSAIVLNEGLYPQYRKDLNSDVLEDERAKEIYFALEEAYRNGSEGFETILAFIRDENLKSFIRKKSVLGEFGQNTDRYIADGVNRLRIRRLSRKREEVLLKIRAHMSSPNMDDVSLNDLLYEKMHLDTELASLKDVRDE